MVRMCEAWWVVVDVVYTRRSKHLVYPEVGLGRSKQAERGAEGAGYRYRAKIQMSKQKGGET